MKILLVSFYYPPEVGAAPTRIANMADGLTGQGAYVDVLTCLPNYPKGAIFDDYKGHFSVTERIGSVTAYRYWTYATVSKNALKRGLGMVAFASSLWSIALKRRLIKSYDYVIVQCPPLPVAVSTIVLFKKIFKKQLLLNVSDLWPTSAVELGAMKEGSKMYRAFAWMERFVYRNADGVFGQSEEILEHIGRFESPNAKFLYRNVKRIDDDVCLREKHNPLKIVYAGLLGVAQDILGILQNIDFKALNAEFHIYGGGNQAEVIKEYIAAHKDCAIEYHGYVSKEQLGAELSKYDASIVPLAVHIHGAVPSKIFDLMSSGIPILFCGRGEGAKIVNTYGLGLTSDPGDYVALGENIRVLGNMGAEEYRKLSENCMSAAKTDFNFDEQIVKTFEFINSI